MLVKVLGVVLVILLLICGVLGYLDFHVTKVKKVPSQNISHVSPQPSLSVSPLPSYADKVTLTSELHHYKLTSYNTEKLLALLTSMRFFDKNAVVIQVPTSLIGEGLQPGIITVSTLHVILTEVPQPVVLNGVDLSDNRTTILRSFGETYDQQPKQLTLYLYNNLPTKQSSSEVTKQYTDMLLSTLYRIKTQAPVPKGMTPQQQNAYLSNQMQQFITNNATNLLTLSAL